MKTKFFFLAALAGMTLASCSDDVFVGDNSPNVVEETTTEAINFGSGFRAVTRDAKVGADAADVLGGQFIVTGIKATNGTGGAADATQIVFPSYTVKWAANSAGTTESNTSDWEYVFTAPYSAVTTVTQQTIKYWDYSKNYYDFAAYSVGKGNTLVATFSDPAVENEVQGTAITYQSGQPAYTLTGTKENLTECYITDMTHVVKGETDTKFGGEVTLNFRSLATKVRMAIYETIPGYSVKDVRFYTEDQTKATLYSNNAFHFAEETATNATLIGPAFFTGGSYTVTFNTLGYANRENSDFLKAHVAMTAATATNTTQQFGTLNYGGAEGQEASGNYLKRTSTDPSFAGSSSNGNNYYTTVLPKEDGTVLEMCVDYTLVPIDGTEETITVHGAKAFVPAVYTMWMPNYAYTYIFKISDNTNGWTNPEGTDPAGLFPITFDAVVLDPQTSGTQTTITTVATPSITTYQKGHVYSASDEYFVPANADATAAATNDAIYAQVMNDNTLKTDLDDSGKSFFYSITNTGKKYSSEPAGWPNGYYTNGECTEAATGTFNPNQFYYKRVTEADVMDALSIRTSADDATTVIGRNGITLTPGTADYTVVKIPGEDGNWITQYYNKDAQTPGMENITAGMVAKLVPTAAGSYAYVYDFSGDNPEKKYIYSAEKLTGTLAPTGFVGNYYMDPNGETACVAGDYTDGGTFYRKYTNNGHSYAVKVIKVVARN